MTSAAGRTVVVTGARSGIGRELLRASAARGDRAFGLDVTPGAAEEDGLPILTVDVRDAAAVGAAFDEIVAQTGGIDVVFSNAGVRTPEASFLELSAEDWSTVVDVNLTGAFHVGQAAAQRMRGRGGVILYTVSQLAFSVVPNNAAYLASKAGLAHLIKGMANELGGEGIRVLGVAPGIVATDMTNRLREDPEWVRARLSRIPADRFAEPAEVAEFMLDLAGPKADYVHGTTVVIDGGYLAGR